MTIFNSLGSNYRLKDIWLTWRELIWPNQKYKKELKKTLSELFGGQATLLFSGRDAIEYCLQAYGINESHTVLTQAFSCSSIEEAIKRTKAKVKYFDIAPNQLTTNLDLIKKAYSQAPDTKVLILQHSLGYANDVEPIAAFCKKEQIILIEDLAQSVGARSSNNKPVGSWGDAVILSFGRDKILDGIAGGAVIFKEQSPFEFTLPELKDWFNLKSDLNNKRLVLKLLLYPTLTTIIRHTYSLGLGKLLHRFFKKIKLMESSILSHHHQYQSFPTYFAPLVINRLEDLPAQLAHRKTIAGYYFQHLANSSHIKMLVNQTLISQSSNLRFPVALESASYLSSLISYLDKQGIFLGDRWYKSPVDSGSHSFSTDYQSGSCPQAERLSKTALNLPTHRVIDLKKAEEIVKAIKDWAKDQSLKISNQ